MKFIMLLIIIFLWIFLSTVMKRILTVLFHDDNFIDDNDLIGIGTVLSPISLIMLIIYYSVKLSIKLSNFIIDKSIILFEELKKGCDIK